MKPVISVWQAALCYLQAAEPGPPKDGPLWGVITGAAFAEYANIVRSNSLLVEVTPEEGRRIPIAELKMLTKVRRR